MFTHSHNNLSDSTDKQLLFLNGIYDSVRKRQKLISEKTKFSLIAAAAGLASISFGLKALKSDNNAVSKPISAAVSTSGLVVSLYNVKKARSSKEKHKNDLLSFIGPQKLKQVASIAHMHKLPTPQTLYDLKKLIDTLVDQQKCLLAKEKESRELNTHLNNESATVGLCVLYNTISKHHGNG